MTTDTDLTPDTIAAILDGTPDDVEEITSWGGPSIEERLAQFEQEFASAWEGMVARVRRQVDFRSPIRTGWGGTLIIASAGYGQIAPNSEEEAAVLRHEADPVSVELSEDGRGFRTDVWHEGDSSDVVYVERWEEGQRTFHGYVDATSRKLVQVG